jgi:hypothetical protein
VNANIVVAAIVVASTGAAQASLPEDVAARHAAVEALRKSVAPLAAPLQVKGSDARVFVSLTPLVAAVTDLAGRPVAQRTIQVQSIGANGKFWEDGDWCHSFVELQSPGDLRATAELRNIVATLRDDGALLLTTRAAVNGRAQVKFQFRGRRVSGPGGIGNVCPPGGGVGSSIGVGFQKDVDLALALTFAAAPDGRSLAYAASFISPDKVSVTAQIGLGPIGTYGHPMSFDLPKAPLASGSFPLLILQSGVFKLPGDAGERQYSFAMTPIGFTTDKKGITANWKTLVQFKTPTP